MAWTYSGDPTASPRDYVRYLIGDTDTTDQLLQDGEIASSLADFTSPLLAAAAACEAIAARLSREVDKGLGQLSVSASQRATAYYTLADALRKRYARKGVLPYFGGRSISEKNSATTNTDAVQPNFRIGQDDLPPNNPFDPRYNKDGL